MLLALVLLKALEAQLTACSRDEYGRMAMGLSLLAFASLGRLYFYLGAFQNLPFLSHEVFFDLAYWITIISGSTLMISGVARWLPLARRHRRLGEERIGRLELLMRIEQLVGVESRIDVTLASMLDHVLQHLSLRAGAVYIYSESSDSFSLLKVGGPSNEVVASLKLPEHAESPAELTRRIVQPSLTLPVQVEREPVALLLFWSLSERPMSSEDTLVVRLAGDIVERHVSLQRSAAQLQIAGATQELSEDLLKPLLNVTDFRNSATAILKMLLRRFGVDYASLALFDPGSPTMQRITVGPEGRSLHESSIKRPDAQSVLGGAYHRGQSILRPDLQSSQRLSQSELPADVDLRCVLAVPFRGVVESGAVLVLAARAPYVLTEAERVLAESLAPVMAALVLGVSGQSEVESQLRSAAELREFATGSGTTTSIQDALALAAATVFRETAASAIRVSVPDHGQEFLQSRALLAVDSVSPLVPPDGQMVLSLMPRHKEALGEKKTVIVSSTAGSANMAWEIEARQVLSEGLGCTLIVPVIIGDRCRAVITAGYDDVATTDRRLSGTQSFIESVAGILSLSIPLVMFRRRDGRRPRISSRPPLDCEIKAQMRSSLTGILGSVEMLKSHLEEADDHSLERYLSIIDRSARRIDQFVSPGEPSPD